MYRPNQQLGFERIQSQNTSLYPSSSLGYPQSSQNYAYSGHQSTMNYSQNPVPPYPTQQGTFPNQFPGAYPGQQGSGYPGQQGSGYPGQQGTGYPGHQGGGYQGQYGGYPNQPAGSYQPQQGGYPGQTVGFQPQPGYQPYQPYPAQQPSGGGNSANQPKYPSQNPGQFGGPQRPNPPYNSGSTFGSTPHTHSSGMSSGTPTIRPYPAFNANADAEALRKAMKGFGCNKSKIIAVLCARSNSQRQEIATAFKAMYGKDLRKELKSELSGDFEDLILGLMDLPADYDAYHLHKAIAGLGTKESVLIEIMCSRSNSEINEIKRVYRENYKQELERDIVGDTSGYFQRLLVSMCAAGRDESMRTDQLKANQDAHALHRAGEQRLGTDETCFNAILAAQNYAQLRLVFQEYQKITGHSIEKAIEGEFSGDIKDGLLAVVACVQNRQAYFAKLLYNSMVGLGTRDTDLIRLVVTRSEIDLGDVKQEFQRLYKKSLVDMIKDDCSGAYKDGLVAIVNGNSA